MDTVKTKWRFTKQYLALRIRPYLTLIFSFVSRDKYRWCRWPRAGTSCIHLCTLVQEVPRAGPWCSGWSCLIGKARVRVSKKQNVSFPLTQYRGKAPWPRGNVLDLSPFGSNFASCVRRAVSSHSSHLPQEVLLTQFSLYVQLKWSQTISFNLFCKRFYPDYLYSDSWQGRTKLSMILTSYVTFSATLSADIKHEQQPMNTSFTLVLKCRVCHFVKWQTRLFIPWTAKLSNLNFPPLEVVSRWCDP